MRVSDSDRDKIASVLGDALAEGRLTGEEHSERLSAAYAARTAADLEPLVADLPGGAQAIASVVMGRPGGTPSGGAAAREGPTSWLVSVFSGTQKRGAWHVPRQVLSVNVFGGSDIDLRDAVLPGGEITIRVVCVFGGTSITVPPEMSLIDSGIALFGGRTTPSDEASDRDGPVLRVHSICVFGGVDVRRMARKADGAGQEPFRDDAMAQLPLIRVRRSELRRELQSARRTARRSARRR